MQSSCASGDNRSGAISEGHYNFASEIAPVAIRQIDTPGVGTYTYAIQAQEEGTAVCTLSPDGGSSFAAFELLGANP